MCLPCRLERRLPGVVVPHRRRNVEALRQLRIHDNFGARIEFADEGALVSRVGKNVVIDVAVCFESLAQVFFFFLGEDCQCCGRPRPDCRRGAPRRP